MVRILTVRESRPENVELSEREATGLIEAGRALAADSAWWGATEPNPERTVVRCVRLSGTLWRLTVLDAVGTIVVGRSLQVVVQPKIPIDHLLYLFSLSQRTPRIHSGRGGLAASSASMWDLIAEWFVSSAEVLLRRGLLRDYGEIERDLPVARGTVLALPTAQAIYSGRLTMACRFDRFGLNSALNRTVKYAARIVCRSEVLKNSLRRRAYRVVVTMDEVGEFASGDEHVVTDRRTAAYADCVSLAKHVIRDSGRSFVAGAEVVWTFLLRTPPLVEEGIREVLRESAGELTSAKRKRQLPGSNVTLNPDIVVADDQIHAIADVKYKLSGSDWKRNDLYQVVAFACGFEVRHAALIEFVPPGGVTLAMVPVGQVRVRHFGWSADDTVMAEDAAAALRQKFGQWALEAAHEAGDVLSQPKPVVDPTAHGKTYTQTAGRE